MKKQFIKLCSLVVCITFISWLSSCKSDPPLADNLVAFETSEVGLTDTDSEVQININLSRAVSTASTLSISLAANGVTYGNEFTTDPAATGNSISVTVPANASTASFKVIRTDDIFLSGSESVTFTITNAPSALVIGETHDVKLSFSSIVSEGSQLQLQGKTDASNYTNTVYVDFSSNTQTPVDRKSWNLAFYSGADFKVVLNPNFQTTAAALDKTDINMVSLADTADVLDLNYGFADFGNPDYLSVVDYYDGDLNKLVFADVSATDTDNKVYLVSFESNRDKATWYKVKVNRSGTTGYKIQYALIGETTIKTLEVSKDANYNFSFISLLNNDVVNVEPTKTNWDIAWSYSTYKSNASDPESVPYWYQDFILLNYLGGAQAAEVVAADADAALTAYTNFSEADIDGLTFSQTRDAIGSKWRATTSSGIYRDRFYVVKDPNGNVYKLRFETMGLGDAGVRGKPVIEYKLVKKG